MKKDIVVFENDIVVAERVDLDCRKRFAVYGNRGDRCVFVKSKRSVRRNIAARDCYRREIAHVHIVFDVDSSVRGIAVTFTLENAVIYFHFDGRSDAGVV